MNGKEKAEHTRRTTTNQFVYHRAGNQEEINCMKGFWREPCETELFRHWLPVVIGVIFGRMTLWLLFWIILLCAVWVYPGLNKRVELMSCMKAKRHIRIEMSESLILFMSSLYFFLNHFFPALYSFSQRWWLAHNRLLKIGTDLTTGHMKLSLISGRANSYPKTKTKNFCCSLSEIIMVVFLSPLFTPFFQTLILRHELAQWDFWWLKHKRSSQ